MAINQIRISLLNLPALKIAIALFVLIVALILVGNLFEHVDQNQIMVIQYPNGSLACFTDGGYHALWFGKAVKFDRRKQFWFSDKDGQGNTLNQQIKVRFNDGGHGDVFGSIAWEMPGDCPHITRAYQKYGNEGGVEHDLVETVVTKAVTMSGPLMSSKESYSEKKNDLIRYMEDQTANGVYQTETQEKEVIDPLSGEKRTANVVTIREKNGELLRQETSPLKDFGIKTYNLSIKNIVYDDTVEKQIQQQQQAVMQVQTAMAQARQAEQQAITAEKNGQADAAKAKWEQEVIKAKAVVQAQQQVDVAKLDVEAASAYKQAETLRGEGEGARKKAVMQANGALEEKLDTYLKVNQMYADAIKNHQGSWSPGIIIGGNGVSGGTMAEQLIQMFAVKTAHDLNLDMGMESNGKQK